MPVRAFHRIPAPPDLRPLGLDFSRPVDVEIGCGVGFHPLHYARANPDRQLVAFERTREKFEKFSGRLRNHERLPNLFPVHGDALAWIVHSFRAASVDRYFILYPNPYPKPSQSNLRFARMPIFARLLATMKEGATLTLATNQGGYAAEAEEWFTREWGLTLSEKSEVARDAVPRTHFEKKYLSRGERCWNLVFRV